ncbi:MAG TPA: ethanolamine ammonia-lyase reactivating factor EutA [Rectinemataceae bacterium]|nr:ethanolamine ammonia-lyase reactivating factor EutA [Rectinemataceae bacterium]
MESERRIVSVGVDIGTTTTQLVFSELGLVAIARAGQIPRLDIADRTVLYMSDIVFTPLLDAETIDAARLADFLRAEYAAAGIEPSQVESGAVIITGETARTGNADAVLAAIADLAGDFVVTVAGPNVEGMIAGRGSGAAAHSRRHFSTVVNLDIGGGSANAAAFRSGELRSSAAMNFGGRVIELEGGRVRAVTGAGKAVLAAVGLSLRPGDRPALADLRRVTDAMAELAVLLARGGTSALAERLYQTPPLPEPAGKASLMFSGGIGYYFYEPLPLGSVEDVARHGDIGPLLAESLRRNAELGRHQILRPEETQRATVLGASSQTLALSGSTIWADQSILPLKNVPVLKPWPEAAPPAPEGLAAAVAAALRRWDLSAENSTYAISLPLEAGLDFERLEALGNALADFASGLPEGKPLLVIIKHDYAQALGQTIKARSGARPLLVIDQVGIEEGDYIDIGSPLMDGRVVPLVVKTLIFYH